MCMSLGGMDERGYGCGYMLWWSVTASKSNLRGCGRDVG